jgi:putative acetyltransferase
VGVLGIALLPQARGQGLGGRLMDAAIDKACRQGITRIELTVRADNLRAKALYERKGFEVEGLCRRAFRVDDQYIDSYSMALVRPDPGAG